MPVPPLQPPPNAVKVYEAGKQATGKRIVAETVVQAPVDVVWRVLTNYERLAEFVPNLESCERLPSQRAGKVGALPGLRQAQLECAAVCELVPPARSSVSCKPPACMEASETMCLDLELAAGSAAAARVQPGRAVAPGGGGAAGCGGGAAAAGPPRGPLLHAGGRLPGASLARLCVAAAPLRWPCCWMLRPLCAWLAYLLHNGYGMPALECACGDCLPPLN